MHQTARPEKEFADITGQMFGKAEARTVLGDSFDPNDATAQRDLLDNVGPAIGTLSHENLHRLPSLARLESLSGRT